MRTSLLISGALSLGLEASANEATPPLGQYEPAPVFELCDALNRAPHANAADAVAFIHVRTQPDQSVYIDTVVSREATALITVDGRPLDVWASCKYVHVENFPLSGGAPEVAGLRARIDEGLKSRAQLDEVAIVTYRGNTRRQYFFDRNSRRYDLPTQRNFQLDGIENQNPEVNQLKFSKLVIAILAKARSGETQRP